MKHSFPSVAILQASLMFCHDVQLSAFTRMNSAGKSTIIDIATEGARGEQPCNFRHRGINREEVAPCFLENRVDS